MEVEVEVGLSVVVRMLAVVVTVVEVEVEVVVLEAVVEVEVEVGLSVVVRMLVVGADEEVEVMCVAVWVVRGSVVSVWHHICSIFALRVSISFSISVLFILGVIQSVVKMARMMGRSSSQKRGCGTLLSGVVSVSCRHFICTRWEHI